MRLYVALAVIVLLAGCTNNQGGLSGGTPKQSTEQGPKPTGGEVSVQFDGLPETVNERSYFIIRVRAEKDVDDLKLTLYNFGSYLKSSCSGTNYLGKMLAGQSKEISCSIEATGIPVENISQEIMYEASYKVNAAGQVSFKVYDSSTWEGSAGGTNTDDLGVGYLEVSPANVKEGEKTELTISLSGGLSEGENCRCSVEKLTLRIPKGFSISGSSEWSRSSCGNFNCYEKRNLDTPFQDRLELSIIGVTKTETFYVSAEVEGAWKATSGSETVSVPAS